MGLPMAAPLEWSSWSSRTVIGTSPLTSGTPSAPPWWVMVSSGYILQETLVPTSAARQVIISSGYPWESFPFVSEWVHTSGDHSCMSMCSNSTLTATTNCSGALNVRVLIVLGLSLVFIGFSCLVLHCHETEVCLSLPLVWISFGTTLWHFCMHILSRKGRATSTHYIGTLKGNYVQKCRLCCLKSIKT